MLRVHNLSAGYGKLQVLDDVSLTVAKGELVALLGPNGAGKTTLVETIFGLLSPMSGGVEYEGKQVGGIGSHNVIRQGIALVPQGRRIFGPLTVERNLELGALAAGRPFNHPVSRRQLDLLFTLFPRLAERRQQRAGTMSGGEQQMLAIGRALMADPKLLLLDEPSLGLAPKVLHDIAATIGELRRLGLTLILVEQNMQLALAQATKVYVLNVGRVVAEETADHFRQEASLQALYMGKNA